MITAFPSDALEFAMLTERNLPSSSQGIDHLKANVMACFRIFISGVAKPYD